MKRFWCIAVVVIFASELLTSCYSKQCPAYQSYYKSQPQKGKGKKKDRFKD